MPKFYATNEADGLRIAAGAYIRSFDTREQAEAYLRGIYRDDEWDLSNAEIAPGCFGDCWQKAHKKPGMVEPWFAPFTYRQLIISPPSRHPGGKAYWITPSPDVLVLVGVKEREG
jgi:hypothetical protein